MLLANVVEQGSSVPEPGTLSLLPLGILTLLWSGVAPPLRPPLGSALIPPPIAAARRLSL